MSQRIPTKGCVLTCFTFWSLFQSRNLPTNHWGGTVFLDDILVTGRNDAEHLQTLARVLDRLQEAGLRLKLIKYTFMKKEAMFLGHKVDETDLHPIPEKVTAIQKAPSPKNVTELKAYLGLLNYYNKFLPNLSTVLVPVHKLLWKDAKWNWGGEQEAAFAQSKKMIHSVQVLVHHDPQKDVILSCDASPYGLSAVLSHKMPDRSGIIRSWTKGWPCSACSASINICMVRN